MKLKSVRLSPNIIPTNYHLELKPDLENFTFSGMETIHLSILQKTRIITLHAKEIEIDTVDVLVGAEKVFGKISYNKK